MTTRMRSRSNPIVAKHFRATAALAISCCTLATGTGGSAQQSPIATPDATVAADAPQDPHAPHLPYRFRNVTIVAGGFISGIVPHPAVQGLMYLRTDIGGAYRTEDGGAHWTPITDWVSAKESNLLGIESIAVDRSDPQTVYLSAGTYDKPRSPNGAVLVSHDRGRHFEVVPMPFKMGGNEDGRYDGERMAVDPNLPATLYLGTRLDGLWTSTDGAKTWTKVDRFPGNSTNRIGVVFVAFDPASGSPKAATPVLYVGVSAPGASLFRSRDAGKTWEAVPGAPAGLLPSHGQIAGDWLYLTWGDAPGPNGIKNGAVSKLNLKTGKWKDITPELPGSNGNPEFGYGGLAVDPEHPGSLLVSTIDHWNGGDNLYRSTDGGSKWTGLKDKAVLDASLSPYLTGRDGKVPFGHWMGAIAIDPFDPAHALYGTGATVWATHDLTAADAKKSTHWVVGANGIEETAVISLLSPPTGAHLFSGLGDIGCFRNDDFAVSPRGGALDNPPSSNCDSITYAAFQPNLMARVGRVWAGQAHGGFSTDGGTTWHPFRSEPPGGDRGGSVALSADGKVMLWATGKGVLGASTDQGASWKITDKAPPWAQIVADPRSPERFYLYDGATAKLFVSNGLQAEFKALPLDVPARARLFAAPTLPDSLWLASGDGLWRVDAAGTAPAAKLDRVDAAYALGFGKPEKEGGYPTLFLSGKIAGVQGIFRSTDTGKTWVQIDDDDHHYGWIGVLSGDPRVFGRVYMGTNGRGVLAGDPAE